MELNGGGKEKNNVEPTRRTELNIAEASSSSLREQPLGEESMQQMSSKAGENMGSESYPERPGEPDCPYYPTRAIHYLETGKCNFGPAWKFHRPNFNPVTIRRVNTLGYPLRLNVMDCNFYLRNGWCKFSKTCKFNHPEPSNSMHWWLSRTTPSQTLCPGEGTSFNASPHWQGPSSYAQVILPQGLAQVPSSNTFPQQNSGNVQFVGSGTTMGPPASHCSFPERPGEPDCPFFAKTGDCKFGLGCRFNHPCKLNPQGLPLRPGQRLCVFYGRYGYCGYGSLCNFHHPIAAPDSLSTSSSSDVPVVQRPLESSSGPATLTLSSESSPVPIPGCRFNHPIGKTTLTSNCELSPAGLPLRPGKTKCVFYGGYGFCGYGSTCKYDHPIASPKGITDSLSTSASDVPVVQQPLEVSSGPAALSSESSPVAIPGKLKRLPSSKPQKMNSDDENV